MEALLSFFSVLKSEIDWLISLFSSATTDGDQVQAVYFAVHDDPRPEHQAIAQDGPLQDSPPADTRSDTRGHTKHDAPQLLEKVAYAPSDDLNPHHVFADTYDAATESPHGSG